MTEHHVKISKEAVPGLELYPWRGACLCGMWQQALAWEDAFAEGYAHMTEVREAEATAQFMETDADDDPDELLDLTPLIKTKIAWDLLDHATMKEWLPRLGLTPGSEENEELDHIASHERAAIVAPICSLAEKYSAIIAEVHTAYLSRAAGNEDEDNEEFTDMVFRITRAGVLAVLCEFLSEGVLDYGQVVKEALQ